VFGAVEKKGHHGERNPATAEKDTAKQHQLAWDVALWPAFAVTK